MTHKKSWPWYVALPVFLACLAALVAVLLFPAPVWAFDLFGLGQAAAAAADATWKVIAINAIESAKFIILLALCVAAMAVVMNRAGLVMERIAQDNKITAGEWAMIALMGLIATPVTAVCVAVSFLLLRVVF